MATYFNGQTGLLAWYASVDDEFTRKLEAGDVEVAVTAALVADQPRQSATFAGIPDNLQLGILAALGRDRAARSLARSQVAYADAGGFVETWASLAAWTLGGTPPPIAADKLYGSSAAAVVRAFTAGAGLARTTLKTVAGGTERYMWFGWSKASAGTVGSPSDFIGVGIRFNSGGLGVNYIITWNRGTETAVGTYTPGDMLYITAGQDSGSSWVDLTSADGVTKVASVQFPKSDFVPVQVGFYASDPRGATGDYFGRTTLRNDSISSPDRTNALLSPSAVNTISSDAQNIRVMLPTGYDSRIPAPLVMYCHGFGGTERTVIDPATNLPAVVAALLGAGYIVASSYAGGGSEVGTGYDAYRTLFNYCADRYAVGPVVLLAESFGGISALRTLAGRSVPNIAAFVGIYPVTNLTSIYANNPTLAPAITAAYGSVAGAQAVGADPHSIPAKAFRGVPMRFYASSGDTAVLKADNCVPFAAKIAAVASESVVVDTTGDHGNASNFQPADVLAFLARVLGR